MTDVKARYGYITFAREAFNRKRGNEVSIESSLGRLTELFALLKIMVTENIISLLTSLGIPLCRKLDWGYMKRLVQIYYNIREHKHFFLNFATIEEAKYPYILY